MGKALNIIFSTPGFPLTGKTPNIIIFSFPLVKKGINPNKSRG